MSDQIRFVRGWMGRPIGFVEGRLGRGQMLSLVAAGFAVWEDKSEQKPTATKRRFNRQYQGETK